MKGKPEVIKMLNGLLAEIHTGAVESATYSAMCKKWGYADLSECFSQILNKQLKYVTKVLDRIVFLDGSPKLQNINKLSFGENIQKMLLSSRNMNMNVVSLCTDGIELSVQLRDYGTRRLLEKILGEADYTLSKVEAEITQSKR